MKGKMMGCERGTRANQKGEMMPKKRMVPGKMRDTAPPPTPKKKK